MVVLDNNETFLDLKYQEINLASDLNYSKLPQDREFILWLIRVI